jgi:prophage DNA circulation protein
MSWRDQLQQGSFRGAPFFTIAAGGVIGRRNIVHEYPLRDLPYAEDLGRKARQFDIDALVLGADYMTARDRLIAALEKPGAGELVHPYRGRLRVVAVDASVFESTDEGGLARFRVTFVESGEKLQPITQTNTAAWVRELADSARVVTEKRFADVFAAGGFLDFVGDAAIDCADSALTSIQNAANLTVLSGTSLPGFLSGLSGVSTRLTALIRTPAFLASSLYAQVGGLFNVASTYPGALTSLRSLFGFGHEAPVVSATTPSRRQQSINQAAIIALVRQAAAIESARALAHITPANYDEAIALRDEVAGQLEVLAETADDDTYRVLTDLRAAVVKDIAVRAADLSRVVRHPVGQTQPVLVLAYRLYGSTAQADDIIARNRIRHPGFVPGGHAIEVLTS